MKTTRDADLAALESYRDQAQNTDHYQALLDSVWEQSKDSFLETMRGQLVFWMRKGLAAVPEEGVPSLKQRMAMAEAELEVEKIEKKIKEYTATPEYQAKLAQRIAKNSVHEADLLMVKQKKGFL